MGGLPSVICCIQILCMCVCVYVCMCVCVGCPCVVLVNLVALCLFHEFQGMGWLFLKIYITSFLGRVDCYNLCINYYWGRWLICGCILLCKFESEIVICMHWDSVVWSIDFVSGFWFCKNKGEVYMILFLSIWEVYLVCKSVIFIIGCVCVYRIGILEV
jgi:hypothetical protein